MCLFCNSNCDDSHSVEHIIPESLGNIDHMLPAGIVCDKCNNYFSRKVEKPFLEHPTLISLRFSMHIPSKRNNIPSLSGIILPNIPVSVNRDTRNPSDLFIDVPDDSADVVSRMKQGKLLLPFSPDMPDGSVTSRFLAKVAIEALARKFLQNKSSLDEILNHPGLKSVKRHSRFGVPREWPINKRLIYASNHTWNDATGYQYEVLHEFTFLYNDDMELFFVCAIFGIEFAINLGSPDIDGYKKWLASHNDCSSLYPSGFAA